MCRNALVITRIIGLTPGCHKSDPESTKKNARQLDPAPSSTTKPFTGFKIGPKPITRDEQWLERIASRRIRGEYTLAITEAQAYLVRFPQDDLGWTMLGHCYEEANEPDEAKRAYDSAIEINPRQSSAWTGLGILHRKKRDYKSAMQSYEKAIEMNPDDAMAHSSLAVVAMILGENETALTHAKKAYLLDKTENPGIIANLAVAYHVNGEPSWRDIYAISLKIRGDYDVKKLERIFSGEESFLDE